MTIIQSTTYKLGRFKFTREETLKPGQEVVVYEDQTTGWEDRPGKNLVYTTVRIIGDDSLTLAYGVPPLDKTLTPYENPYKKETINTIFGLKSQSGEEIKFSWRPGAERK